MVFSRRSVLGSGVAFLGLTLANRNHEVRAETVPEKVTVHCLVNNTRPPRPICVEADGESEAEAKDNLIKKVMADYSGWTVGPAELGECEKFDGKSVCPCGRWTAIAKCKKSGQLTVEVEASARTRIAAKRLALKKLSDALCSWGYDPECCGGCMKVTFEKNCP